MADDDGKLEVRNITTVLANVSQWEPVGVHLGISAAKLDEIKTTRMMNPALCKISMADAWLRRDVNASWEKLAKALESTGNDTQAQHIRDNYCDDDPRGGAAGNSRRTATPHSAGGADNKRRRYEANNAVRDPPEVHLRKMYENGPEAGEEESRRDVAFDLIINNDDVDVNCKYRDDNGMETTLLHEAITVGDITGVKTLIALGANADECNGQKLTPLSVASLVQKKNKDLLQLLKGVSKTDPMPVQETMGAPRPMDVGDEETISKAGDRVLCLDNSSTMALVQLELLGQIEKATGKKIIDLFQWIVASGIGGLLVLLMVYGDKSISQLRRFYYRLYKQVFANPDAKDKGKELEAIVIQELDGVMTPGNTVYMQSVTQPKLLIGAVDKRMSTVDLKFFSNCSAIYGENTHVYRVARYTCSSPLYFGEYDNYIDTGVLCKNLCGVGLKKINSYYEHLQQVVLDPIALVVSLGDGIPPAQPLSVTGQLSTYYLGNPKLDGRAAKDLLSVFQNMVALYNSAACYQSEGVSSAICEKWCESRDIYFFRFNPLLEENIPVPEEVSLDALINVAIKTITHIATEDGKENLERLQKEL